MSEEFYFDASKIIKRISDAMNKQNVLFNATAKDMKILFDAFVKAGFTEEQAIEIITRSVAQMNSKGE